MKGGEKKTFPPLFKEVSFFSDLHNGSYTVSISRIDKTPDSATSPTGTVLLPDYTKNRYVKKEYSDLKSLGIDIPSNIQNYLTMENSIFVKDNNGNLILMDLQKKKNSKKEKVRYYILTKLN